MTIASAPCFKRAGRELGVDGAERVVELGHEDAAHGVDHQHVRAVRRLDQSRAAARRARRIVDRAQQPVVALDEDERLLLVEGVVAERHRVGAGLQQLLEDRLGDAEAAGRVLAVDDRRNRARSAAAGRAAPRSPPGGPRGRRYRRETTAIRRLSRRSGDAQTTSFIPHRSARGRKGSAPNRAAGHNRDGARRRSSSSS